MPPPRCSESRNRARCPPCGHLTTLQGSPRILSVALVTPSLIVCIHVCTCLYAYMCVPVCMHTYVCLIVCIHVCIYTCVCLVACIHVCT